MIKRPLSTKLDWNRMLGFEQIAKDRASFRDEVAQTLGPKVGGKVGEKVGLKIGSKLGVKTGLKG